MKPFIQSIEETNQPVSQTTQKILKLHEVPYTYTSHFLPTKLKKRETYRLI